MGYDAFALDLFGKGNRPKEKAAKKALTKSFYNDREKMRTLILAGLAEARKSTKAKAVVAGYCFGGAGVLELARSGKAADIAGYVTFHGGLATPEGQSYPKDTPPMLIAHGGGDTSVTMEHVAALSKELEATGIKYEVQIYSGAPHAFTVFGSGRYRKVADEQSWDAFGDFLKTNLN
jgi:dienelactone hydrolase